MIGSIGGSFFNNISWWPRREAPLVIENEDHMAI